MIYWYDGSLRDEPFSMPIDAPALRYGMGLFETLLYNGRAVCRLEAHLRRLRDGLRSLDIPFAECDFEEAVSSVLAAGGLTGLTARVNILYPVLSTNEPAKPVVAAAAQLVDTAKEYALTVSPNRFASPLASYKTLNYLYFYLEHKQAIAKGCDDAVIAAPNGRVLETSRGSLLFSDGRSFFAPTSAGRLPGTAQEAVREALDLSEKDIRVETMSAFEHVYILNSIIGMRPVIAVDDHSFKADKETCLAADRIIHCLD